MTQAMEWLHGHEIVLWWFGAVSVLMFLGSLIVIPFVLAMLPADYFSRPSRPQPHWIQRHPVVWFALLVVKNGVGILLVVLGVVLLLLPGQGLLSILAGVALLNIPGKFRLMRWMVRRPAVLRSINWLRRLANRPPLVVDEDTPADSDQH